MKDWLVAHWPEIRTLVGPMATLIAATIAAVVAIVIGVAQTRIARAQKAIAKSQRDLVVDKLKCDLFDRRLDIYLAIKELGEQLKKVEELDDNAYARVNANMQRLEPVAFLFDSETVHYTMDIFRLSNSISLNLRLRGLDDYYDEDEKERLLKEVKSDQAKLSDLMRRAVDQFMMPLTFPALRKSERYRKQFWRPWEERHSSDSAVKTDVE
jgi:hypothetical protein